MSADFGFEGFPDRECGEHHGLRTRAWCPGCSEYCYENAPCRGCEMPLLRAVIAKLESALREAPMPLRESMFAKSEWHERYGQWWHAHASEDALKNIYPEAEEREVADEVADEPFFDFIRKQEDEVAQGLRCAWCGSTDRTKRNLIDLHAPAMHIMDCGQRKECDNIWHTELPQLRVPWRP